MEDPDHVSRAFDDFSPTARPSLDAARRMIVEEAAALPEAASLEASLKWGQPSYVIQPKAGGPKTGTPIRLGETKEGDAALFVHCGTTLVADWAAVAGPDAQVQGNRAVVLDAANLEAVRPFIRLALTYHHQK